jgi:hypothetical protein
MAKGRQSLVETTHPDDIIETNEETGSIPFFDIDNEYSISGCYDDLALVIKKNASKKGKSENGEDPNKVYTYYRWDELKYDSELSGIFEIYLKVKRLNAFKGQRSKDIKELIKIEQDLYDFIHNKLDIKANEQFKQVCNLTDTVLYLKEQITAAKSVLNDYNKLIADADAKFREGKQIIVDNMPKEKKHRLKLEED